MSGNNPFSRVLSLRDKKRNSSKPRTDLSSLFAIEEKAKKPSKEEDRKIQDITQRLASLGHQDVPYERIEYALRSKSAQGDPKEAIRLLMLYDDSVAGLLRPFDPSVKMLGAENREKTTCYLDSLLFAMFAKPDVFEAVLFNTFDDEPRKRLVVVMRLWVNLLRTGRLVTTDIMARLQEALADCGWADAGKIRQQDASEAFSFITDKLQLPLLTLKTDLYHQGREDDKDDHKFITERMLDVAIPDNVPAGETITLEMCLEEYFNNRVEVKRHLQKRVTVDGNGARKGSTDKGATYVEAVELDSRANSPTPETMSRSSTVQRPLHMRNRATSIFSDRKLKLYDSGSKKDEGDNVDPNGRPRAASMKKEVLMPAWQFLNLIPWYTDSPAGEDDDAQVKAHFSKKRPMLGICLKRYSVTPNGVSRRLNTHIDIPLEMASPHFAAPDDIDHENPKTGNFKLSLQSIVCHRGHQVDSGHYIALVRADAPRMDNHDSFSDPASSQTLDQSHDAWLRLDDLATERVQVVDIAKALRNESPYLLFYRVQPIHEAHDGEHPPPYDSSNQSFELVDEKLSNFSHVSGRPDGSPEGADWQSRRPSTDAASPEESRGRSSFASLRRTSIQWQTGNGAESLRTDPASTEPTTPLEEVKSPSSVLSMLSRQSTKSKGDSQQCRPPSDPTEKRFSVSMSKISSRLSSTKLAPDIIVDEVADEHPTLVHAHKEESPDTVKTKTKEKKRKFLPSSRRGSGGTKHGKQPERECVVM